MLRHELRQHIRIRKNRTGRLPVRVSKTRQRIKRAVNQAAAIQHDETLLLAGRLFLLHMESPFYIVLHLSFFRRAEPAHLTN